MSDTPTPAAPLSKTEGDTLAEGVKTPRAGERTPLSNGQAGSNVTGGTPAGEASGGGTSPPAG